jgi:hypothetical protein
MKRNLMLAHLHAMRAAVDALIFEVAEDEPAAVGCCEAPKLQRVETYGGAAQLHCTNCDKWFELPPQAANGVTTK